MNKITLRAQIKDYLSPKKGRKMAITRETALFYLCMKSDLRLQAVYSFLEAKWLLTVSQTSPGFYMSVIVQACLKHCGKRRNCSLRAISLLRTVLSNCMESFLSFSFNLELSSANPNRVKAPTNVYPSPKKQNGQRQTFIVLLGIRLGA